MKKSRIEILNLAIKETDQQIKIALKHQDAFHLLNMRNLRHQLLGLKYEDR